MLARIRNLFIDMVIIVVGGYAFISTINIIYNWFDILFLDSKKPAVEIIDGRIEGYAGQASINVGESIDIYVRTTQPFFDLRVYRMGWYNGNGRLIVAEAKDLPGENYENPGSDPKTGLIEVDWSVSYNLQTDTSWSSGVYLVELTAEGIAESYALFVVRDDVRVGDILFQLPVTTYQAYNNWGGKSLYDFNSPSGRAYKVSYDRPYKAGQGTGLFFEGDYQMLLWLEREGYDVAYATSIDMEEDPHLLDGYKVFITNFHDEYWSWDMRDHLIAARDRGVHLLFFASNNMYWQIRFEDSTTGKLNRVQVGYKDVSIDPMATSPTPERTTVRWRDAPVNRPENELLGIMYETQWDYGGYYPYVVSNADHWIYEGTELQNGDSIPDIVGYEVDTIWENGLTPPDIEVLSNSPVVDNIFSTATLYTAPSGARVFGASTNWWAMGLVDTEYDLEQSADPRMEKMTKNLLARLIN